MFRNVAFIAGLLMSGSAFAQAPAAPAPAAGAASLQAGTKVTGPAGAEVGTVVSVQGPNAVVKTDKYEVAIPVTSIRVDATGAVVGMTREQFNAGIEEAMAKVGQMLTKGAAVSDTAGASVGTVETVEAEFVTVKLASGKTARLPRAAFAAGANGLLVGLTAAQIEAQLPS